MIKYLKSKPTLSIVILYLTLPRVIIGLLWGLTTVLKPLINDHIWILLGIVLLPYTFLAYVIGMSLSDMTWNSFVVIGLVVGLAIDLIYIIIRD